MVVLFEIFISYEWLGWIIKYLLINYIEEFVRISMWIFMGWGEYKSKGKVWGRYNESCK